MTARKQAAPASKPHAPKARATKRKATAQASRPEAETVEPSTPFFDYSMLEMSRRETVAAVANVFTGFLSGAALGAIAEVLSASVFAATGSMFISLLTLALGWAIAIVASIMIGARVAKYIAQGKAEDDLVRARDWVQGAWHKLTVRFGGEVQHA